MSRHTGTLESIVIDGVRWDTESDPVQDIRDAIDIWREEEIISHGNPGGEDLALRAAYEDTGPKWRAIGCSVFAIEEDWIGLVISIAEDKGVHIACMDFSEIEARTLALIEADRHPEPMRLEFRMYDELSDWPVMDLTVPDRPAPCNSKQNRAAHHVTSVKRSRPVHTRRKLMSSRSGYRGIKALKKL